jgi:hypothetical protein
VTVCCGEPGYITGAVLFCHDGCEKGNTICCFRDFRASYFACHKIKMLQTHLCVLHVNKYATAYQAEETLGELGQFIPEDADRSYIYIYIYIYTKHLNSSLNNLYHMKIEGS